MTAFFIVYYSNTKETVICLDLNQRQVVYKGICASYTTVNRSQSMISMDELMSF